MHNIKTLNEFVKESLNCSDDVACDFIRKFRHHDAIDYGKNIIENHAENFVDGFDFDDIDEETLACVVIRLEDDYLVDLSVIEDKILKDVFRDKYE